jgi:hypothetical protein
MWKKSIVVLVMMSSPATATDINFRFKNPSFSGDGASAHWLTIENQEHTRKQDIQDRIEEQLKAAAAEEKNSFLNRFLNNLQSRIYSRLAAQLTDNLFGQQGDSGILELEGNTIEYVSDGETLTLKITQEDGSITEISIPLSGFSF